MTIDGAMSDHFCIVLELNLSLVILSKSKLTKKWYISENTGTQFIEMMSSTPSPTSVPVNELLHDFVTKTTTILNHTAPVKIDLMSGKERAPWRNAGSVTII